MAARYSTTFTNLDNVEYKVEILDSEFSGTASDFDFADTSGFLLSMEADENRFTPIIPSSCTIQMMIQVTDAYFVAALAAQSDNRFFLQISRNDDPWKVIWVGEIATDLIEYTDEYYPFPIQLQAFDTLSLLKNTPFPATAGTRQHFIQQLFTIMGKTRILDKLPNPSTVLRTAVQWYESQMFTTAPASTLDPLSQSSCYHDAWMYWDDKLGTQYLSCWDVLEQIAYRFGAQFFFEEGAFNFIQVNRPGTSLNFRYYNNAMTKTTGTEYLAFSGANRNEGKFSFVPAIGTAKLVYPFSLGINTENLLPSQGMFETAVSIGNIQGGSEEQLLFSGTINIFMTTAETEPLGEPHVWVFHLKIKIGSYYLTNENGYPQWTTNSAKYYKIKSVVIAILRNYNRTIPVSFTTPYIPASGAATFQMIRYGFENESGASYTLPYAYTPTYYASGFTLRLKIDENMFDAGEIQFTETNSATAITRYNSTIELPDLLLGDGPHEYAKGRMMVYDASTSSWVISEEGWTIDGTGTGVNINTLLLQEIIAGQEKPRRVFDGVIFNSRGGMLKIVSFDGLNFTMRRGTFDAYHGLTTGVWVRNYAARGGSTSGEIIISDPAIIDAVFSSGQAISDTYINTVETSETIEGGGVFESEGESQIASLTEKTTPVDADVFMIDDSGDSFKKKKLSWLRIKTTLSSVFYGLFSGQFNGTTAKTSLANNDVLVIEDSEAAPTAYIKKSIKWSSIRTILNNVYYGTIAGQFAATTEKTSIAANDYLIIEDSAASNAKKSLKYSTLKTALDLLYGFWSSVTGGIRTNNRVGINIDPGTGTALKVVDSYYGIDAKSTGNGALRAEIEGSSSFSAAPVIPLYRSTTSTAANGIGMSIPFYIQNSAGSFVTAAYIEVKLSNATSGSEKSEMTFIVNSATRLKINEDNDIVVGSGSDIKFSAEGDGVILKSPGGTFYRVTVDNSGNLVTTTI